jgi:uncharacterized protein (DUF927 family)
MIDPREVEQVVYMLANGTGKSRETRNMTGRRTLEWLCVILSSGEIQLSDCAAIAGQKLRGGAEIRMATVPADAGEGMGIFETLHGTRDPRIFAETLEAAAKTNYGTAAPAIIRYIIDHWDAVFQEAPDYINNLSMELLEDLPDAAPEVRRVLRRFLTSAYAGELATKAGYTGWTKGESTAAAIKCFRAWVINRGGWEASDTINALQQVRNILASQHGRFRPADPSKDAAGNLITERIPNSLGYWKMTDDQLVYLVDRGAFKSELCAGFNAKDVLQELLRRDFLCCNEKPRLYMKAEVTLPTGNDRISRFVGIKATILEDESNDAME